VVVERSPIVIPEGQYWKFYKQKQQKIWQVQMNLLGSNLEFQVNEIFKFGPGPQFFLSKVVNLPNDRIFLIGGAEDLSCKKSFNNVYEMCLNRSTNLYEMVPK
jgi:hypothetical protein